MYIYIYTHIHAYTYIYIYIYIKITRKFRYLLEKNEGAIGFSVKNG